MSGIQAHISECMVVGRPLTGSRQGPLQDSPDSSAQIHVLERLDQVVRTHREASNTAFQLHARSQHSVSGRARGAPAAWPTKCSRRTAGWRRGPGGCRLQHTRAHSMNTGFHTPR